MEREVFIRRLPNGSRDLFLVLVDVVFHLLLFLPVLGVIFLVPTAGAPAEEGVADS